MNEVMNAILTRRSIRKFTADPIPAEVLEDRVKAALHAPSGMGKQTWQFTVVTNHEIIHRLCGLIGTELGREGYDMYGPAAVINQMQNIHDRPAVRALLNEIGVPADHVIYGVAALGYADPSVPVEPKERTGKVVYVK